MSERIHEPEGKSHRTIVEAQPTIRWHSNNSELSGSIDDHRSKMKGVKVDSRPDGNDFVGDPIDPELLVTAAISVQLPPNSPCEWATKAHRDYPTAHQHDMNSLIAI